MLDYLGASDAALFGNVPDEHQGASYLLGSLRQKGGGVAKLYDAAGGSTIFDHERLYRIDDH